jgi:transcriptional regulator with XRE-family HTH domain
MSRKMRGSKTKVQMAMVELRRHCGFTQAQLAQEMDVTLTTVSRWESIRPPSGPSLIRIQAFAEQVGRTDLAKLFAESLSREFGLVGSVGPVWSAGKPLRDALAHLVGWHENSPEKAHRHYLAVVSAMATAHAAMLKDTTMRELGASDEELHRNQILLNRLEEQERAAFQK